MKALLFLTCIVTTVASLGAPVRVAFKIIDHQGHSLTGTTVKLYKMNHLVMVEEQAPTLLKWMLEEGEHYTIEVSGAGFITKRMGITAGMAGVPNSQAQQFTLALEAVPYNDKAPGAQPAVLPSEVVLYETSRWSLDHYGPEPGTPLHEQEGSPADPCPATGFTRE